MADNSQQDEFYGKFSQQSPNFSDLKATSGPSSPEMDVIGRSLSDISSGLRILEDRYANLRKKTQLTDQALLESQRNFAKERRLLRDELMDAKMKIQDLIDEMVLIKSELQGVVKQRDIKVLEKYLDMWDPIEFITRKEAEQIIDQSLGRAREPSQIPRPR